MNEIFGNRLTAREAKNSFKSAKGYRKSCPDDADVDYNVRLRKNRTLNDYMGVVDIRLEGENEEQFDTEKGIIVSNIRMGFGHYRISMAMASAAYSMGYTPYWLDLNSFPKTAATKIITKQNDLYSLGSRLSRNPISLYGSRSTIQDSGNSPTMHQTLRHQSSWHLCIRIYRRRSRSSQLTHGLHSQHLTVA